MTTTPARPKRGRPKAGTDDAVAVAYIEAEVVRLAQAGKSFYAIDAILGISNSDRVFRRAVEKGRNRTREDAYALESLRLEELAERAFQALDAAALDGLAERIADLLEDRVSERWEDDAGLPEAVRSVIERAYTDTWRGIPVALQVHDRRAKLDGLTHSDRVADARLELDRATVQMWGALFAEALGVLDVPAEDKRRVIERWGELAEGAMPGEEP